MTEKTIQNTIELGESNRKYATYLAYAYLFFNYVRPQDNIPGMSSIPIAGVVFLLLAIWGVFHLRGFAFKSPLKIIFILCIVYAFSAIGAVNVEAHRYAFMSFTHFFPQSVALYILFDSRKNIVSLYKLWVVIYFFVALITFKNGGMGPGDFSRDNNDVALTLSIGLAMVFYTAWFPGVTRLEKYLIYGVCIIIAGAIVITASRGGFLGLVTVLLVFWWFSRHKIKLLIYAIVLSATLSGILLSVLPDGYLDEMSTISDGEDATRVERLRLWETAWIMYKENPVFGVGVKNQHVSMGEYQRKASWYTGKEASYNGKVVHSVYFQVLSETGTFGAIFNLYAMFIMPLLMYRLRNRYKGNTEDDRFKRMLAQSIIAAMAAYVVSGAFISVAYYPHIFIWITLFAINKRFLEMPKGAEELDAGSNLDVSDVLSEDDHRESGFLWDKK